MSTLRIGNEPAAEPVVAPGAAPVVEARADGNGVNIKPPVPGSEPAKPEVKPTEGEAPKPEAKPEVPGATPRIEAPKPEAAKLDLSAAVSDMGKDGKISEASYKAAEAKGLSRADVDTYVAGHQSRVTAVATALSTIAGGNDNLKAVLEWASANTDEATRTAFNAAMDRADTSAASLMVRGLLSQYNDAVGVEGERIGGNSPNSGVVPYASWEQVRADMATDKYKRDPAFQAAVAKRMEVSFNR